MGVIRDRLKHAWNAFTDAEKLEANTFGQYGSGSSNRPDRNRMRYSNERSIISSVYTRISIDVAAVSIRHVRLDDQDRYQEDMVSGLNYCLTGEANLDQAARHFRQDIAQTLFDKGVAAIVPIDTTLDPNLTGGYDIQNMRVAEILEWFPNRVRVSVYNEKFGRRQELTLDKKYVAIIENPLYSVMNEPNSTLQRLIRKLNLLDAIDEQSGSGKLDIIIQLPYAIKSESRREQAEQRRKDMEFQLKDSQYGVAYSDATEKITQLNRPAENNLLKQVEYLTEMLYAQLGITADVMNGTADEATMLNYNNRTIDPIVTAIVEAMRRSFLTKTARSQKQSIMSFYDPFKVVPITVIAEVADKFTRNEILTSNEIRQIVGRPPVKDAKADKLINSNMPVADTGSDPPKKDETVPEEKTPVASTPDKKAAEAVNH